MRMCPYPDGLEQELTPRRVSLTARLFFERLLDHDQYLGWFLTSLETSASNTVPVWLLMLGIYWNNIMRYRKRGRRLAELLLAKLQRVRALNHYLIHKYNVLTSGRYPNRSKLHLSDRWLIACLCTFAGWFLNTHHPSYSQNRGRSIKISSHRA